MSELREKFEEYISKGGKEHFDIYATFETYQAGYDQATSELQAEKEALEKKLAEQQITMKAVASWLKGGCESEALLLSENFPAEELTKREVAARQQGFEEGKQAGRDEVLKELSEQEPFMWLTKSGLRVSDIDLREQGGDAQRQVAIRNGWIACYARPPIREGWVMVQSSRIDNMETFIHDIANEAVRKASELLSAVKKD